MYIFLLAYGKTFLKVFMHQRNVAYICLFGIFIFSLQNILISFLN